MQFSLSGSLASMANGLPYSIGAAVAYPKRQVVCIVGAGGFTIEQPNDVEKILREALAYPGPAVVQAVVDPNEPPLPGKISMDQAMHFAEALARGERDRWDIIKTVLEDKVREVI